MKINYVLPFLLLITLNSLYAQRFPGGVSGADVWYVVNDEDLSYGLFPNQAISRIRLANCGDIDRSLFNFNPSIITEKLCLKYVAPLENSTGRDLFFVGEPHTLQSSYSHVGTQWNEALQGHSQIDSIVRNFFDLNNKNLYAWGVYDDFSSDKNANVNFYRTRHYNIDRMFKSYGQQGETTFYLGLPTPIDPNTNYEDNFFHGNFPEYISFPRELSTNEKNRVESYLALKYGLTLKKNTSYRNSSNLVFWNKDNNDLFPNRIFGMGKDDISTLNQLQSESTHLKKHLIAAIEDIMETNKEKQQLVDIPDKNFIVFGDNGGADALENINSDMVKFWKKIWLTQVTGKESQEFPIYFKLHLNQQLIETINEGLTLWMLQDQYVTNDTESDFDNEHIIYHKVQNVDLNSETALFYKVFFDTDQNKYDQFTFGVGPEMIVQAQLLGCDGDDLKIKIVISGGKEPYHIKVIPSLGQPIDDYTSVPFYYFSADSGIDYEITVTDATSLNVTINYTPAPWNFWIDLGPDQNLSDSQPEVLLDAGQGINDPQATYQWFLDGQLLTENGSTYIATQPGDYDVVVTSNDRSCEVTDHIRIGIPFEAHLSHITGCDEYHNSITITPFGGFSPFVTSLTGTNGTYNHAHSSTTTISDIPYGNYTVTVTDSMGEIYQANVEFPALGADPVELDIVSQLETFCSACIYLESPYLGYPLFLFETLGTYPFTLDASALIADPNVTYEWFIDGVSMGIYTPNVTFDIDFSGDCYNVTSLPTFTVVATNPLTGCSANESFMTKGFCPVNWDPESSPASRIADPVTENSVAPSLTTKLYPNPGNANVTFYYEAVSQENFEGVVEVFNTAGTLIYSTKISGSSKYILPYTLTTSGVYLIRINSSLGIIETDRIIIK